MIGDFHAKVTTVALPFGISTPWRYSLRSEISNQWLRSAEKVAVQFSTERSQWVHPEANRSLRALAFNWPIFLDLMEYANQIQELTERSVSSCASRCTHRVHSSRQSS